MEGPPPQPQFEAIVAEIEAMTREDQDMRTGLDRGGLWDETIDTRNTTRMKEIIAQVGWPTISKVGIDASENAWSLVQHADHDVAFQEQCLALMKRESTKDINPRNVATLGDRIRVNSGRPQIYGTQFDQIDGKHVPQPIEDEANVDERRSHMGLGTLAEGIQEMYEKYGPPTQDDSL